MADLDERGEEARAALRDEARADVEVAQEEERDRRQQEPGLDENDLDRDDRGETPEELRATGAADPSDGRLRETLGPEDELQRDDRSIIDMITSWKDIAATPALIACAAELRTIRMGDFRVTRSLTKRADPATSASVPGGRRTTPAGTATSEAESSTFVAMRIGRSDRRTQRAQI